MGSTTEKLILTGIHVKACVLYSGTSLHTIMLWRVRLRWLTSTLPVPNNSEEFSHEKEKKVLPRHEKALQLSQCYQYNSKVTFNLRKETGYDRQEIAAYRKPFTVIHSMGLMSSKML